MEIPPGIRPPPPHPPPTPAPHLSLSPVRDPPTTTAPVYSQSVAWLFVIRPSYSHEAVTKCFMCLPRPAKVAIPYESGDEMTKLYFC